MPEVVITVAGTDVTDDVVFEFAEFRSQVNGKPGDARMRVRDLTSTYSFTQGDDWLLTVDGQAVWRGYVMGVTRTYIAPALDVAESGLQRFWDLVGSDLNLLFAKRIVVKASSPAVVEGTQFPPATMDTTAITELLTNWLDLSGDDLDTTSEVDHVGDLDPAQATRAWSGGWQWGQAMDAIAKLPGAIYYLRPEAGSPRGTLVYCDVDTPSAPFGLSDTYDGTTTKGYREMEVTLDGTSLANDVLAWGMGYGSQTPVFVRDQDAASQATHGRWQTGQVTTGVYKQATINRIAESIIDGSPENQRGAKDDRVSVQLVTYAPGLRCGDKVAFSASMFGFSDTIPIRQMRVSFESPADPRYELVLSHDIDAPWGFVDQFWPDMPKFGGTPMLGGWRQRQSGGEAVCEYGITDTFTREVLGGWGTSDVGLVWTNDVSDGVRFVDGSAGVLEAYSDGDYYSSGVVLTDLDPYVEGTASVEFEVYFNHSPHANTPFSGGPEESIYVAFNTFPVLLPTVQIGRDSSASGAFFIAMQDAWSPFSVSVAYPSGVVSTQPFRVRVTHTMGGDFEVRCWQGGSAPVSPDLVTTPPGARYMTDFRLETIQASLSASPLQTLWDNLNISKYTFADQHWQDFDVNLVLDLSESPTYAWPDARDGTYFFLRNNPWFPTPGAQVYTTGGIMHFSKSPGSTSNTFAVNYPITDGTKPWSSTFTATWRWRYRNDLVPAWPQGIVQMEVVLQPAPGGDPLSGSPQSFIVSVAGPPDYDPGDPPIVTVWAQSSSVDLDIHPEKDEWIITKISRDATTGVMSIKSWMDGTAEPGDWAVQYNGIAGNTQAGIEIWFDVLMVEPWPTSTQVMEVDWIDMDYDGRPCYWDLDSDPVFPVSSPVNFFTGMFGFGCENAIRVTSTQYQTSSSFAPSSVFLWIDGLLQRRGIDFNENPDLRSVSLSTSVGASSTVRVCYVAQATPS